MIVRDIKQDAKEILGYCEDSVLYNRLTHAIEVLANRGSWDAMLGYMDIVATDNIVTLPYQVESPIRLNINNNPSFSRSRLYEFTLNGPGNEMSETTGYSWMDGGTSSVMVQPPSTSFITAVSASAADNGKKITVVGIPVFGIGPTQENNEVSEKLTLNYATPPVSTYSFRHINGVFKDFTAGNVMLKAGSTVLSNYFASETEPQYRRILLSKPAAAVRMLFRRATAKVISDDDFIPLNSHMAILIMLRALETYRKGSSNEDFNLAKSLEEQAVKLCKEEQESRTGFDLSSTSETQSALDLNYNNSDSIIVADIYDDMAGLLGPVGRQKIFDHITESVEALNNKGQWDGLDGYIDITVEDSIVTLPRYIEVPIEINIGGRPTFMRNKWFEFHLNGPGSECCGTCSWAWDDRGEVVTIVDPCEEQQLVAIPDLPEDNGKFVRVFGYDANDKWVRTLHGGELTDGIWVEINSGLVTPALNATKIQRITRITKDSTKGFVKLQGFNQSRNTIITLGYYYPDETEPTYRRIRIGANCEWIRMRYRKKALKVTSLTDPLHLKSKLAIMCMARAVLSMKKGEIDKANEMEAKATQLLAQEQDSRNPGQTFSFQFDTSSYGGSPDFGQY